MSTKTIEEIETQLNQPDIGCACGCLLLTLIACGIILVIAGTLYLIGKMF